LSSLLPCGIEPCGGSGETGTGDDKPSRPSPVGAARAESDDDDEDDDTANEARMREELDGNLMKNDSSGRNRDKGVGFELIHCEFYTCES
jgi:hypothetical protein